MTSLLETMWEKVSQVQAEHGCNVALAVAMVLLGVKSSGNPATDDARLNILTQTTIENEISRPD